MDNEAINIAEKFSMFSDHWAPKIIARMNDYEIKLVRFQGDFVWHSHENTDEVFIVLDGEMVIVFLDERIRIKTGELYVVPKGVKHKPFADQECKIMLIEPAGTANTGDAGGDRTAQDNIWI